MGPLSPLSWVFSSHRAIASSFKINRVRLLIIFGWMCAVVLTDARSQPVVNSLIDPVSGAPVIPPSAHPNQLTPDTTALAPTAPIQIAGLGIYPGASYRYLDSDGLQNRAGERRKTNIQNYSAFLRVTGSGWEANYSPSLTTYSSSEFDDSVAHVFNAFGTHNFADTTLRLDEHYESNNSPQIETGAQTKEEYNALSIGLEKSLSSALSFEIRGIQSYHWSEISSNTKDWSNEDWVHYQLLNDTIVSGGFAFGHTSVSGRDMDTDYYRPQLGIRWTPTRKISLDAQLGYETREFEGTLSRKVHTPTYGGSILYSPFSTTSFRLSAGRSLQIGYVSTEIQRTSDWGLSLQQRLLGRLQFGAAYSDQRTDYLGNQTGLGTGREDRSRFTNLSLSTNFMRNGNIALLYMRTSNGSSAQRFAFVSNQVGFQISFQY